jgi:putative PEP-CTERM system TPR-repeat lipoprotein
MRRLPPHLLSGLLFLLAGLGPAGQVWAQNAATQYEQALVAYNLGEIRTAYIHLRNALQEDPYLLSGHLLLAKIQLAMGNGAEAEQALRTADGLGADRSLILVPLARAYLQQGKPDRVINELFPMGSSPREDAEVLALRGQAHLELDEVLDAERAFQQAWERAPNSVPALLGRVQTRLLRGALKDALADARRAVEIAPYDSQVLYLKAVIERDLGDAETALADFERAVDAEPAHLPAEIGRVGVLLDLGREEDAAAVVAKLRKTYPRDPRALYLEAVVANRRGENERAEAVLVEAAGLIDQLPRPLVESHSPTLLLAGLINFSLRKWEQAGDYLGLYINRHPEEIGPRKLYAQILLERRETEAAIEIIDPALQKSRDDPALLSLMAEAYMQIGRHVQASLLLEEAMAVDADDADTRAKQAVNDFLLGYSGRAIAQLASIFDAWPNLDRAGSSLVVMLMQKRDYARAIEVADELVAKHPDAISHLNLKGAAHFANGDLATARTSFEGVLARDPLFLPARLNLAKLDRAEGRLGEARERLEKILEERPTHAAAMLELARTMDAMGDRDGAVLWAEKALSIDPDAVAAAVYLSELLIARREVSRAVAVLENAEVRYGNDIQVLEALSRAYLAAGERSTAQVVLQRATSAAGYDSRALLRVAALQQEAGDLDGAVWALQKAADSEPDLIPTRVRLGELLIALGRFDKAAMVARELAEDYPDRPYGPHLLGLVELRQGKHAESLESFRAALALEDSPILAVRLHEALARVEGLEAGIEFLEDWAASHPDDAIVRQGLAEGYLRAGRWDEAGQLYEALLEEAPKSPLLLNNLALIYSHTGDPRAKEYARRAYSLQPGVAQIGDTLGWVLVRAGEHTEGLKYLRDAQSRAAGDPGIGYHIAVALDALGRPAEAMRELQAALRSHADFPERKDAEALLERLQPSLTRGG